MFELVLVNALVEMILLHGPGGAELAVNPAQVTSLRARTTESEGFFTPGVECMINLADGKFITVRETCEYVRERLREARQ